MSHITYTHTLCTLHTYITYILSAGGGDQSRTGAATFKGMGKSGEQSRTGANVEVDGKGGAGVEVEEVYQVGAVLGAAALPCMEAKVEGDGGVDVVVERVLQGTEAKVEGEGGADMVVEGVLPAAAMMCLNTQTGMRRWMASGAATRRDKGMFGVR